MGCISALVRVVNYLIIAQALVIIGGASYIASKGMSSFVYVLFSVGGFVLLTGILGVRVAAGRKRPSDDINIDSQPLVVQENRRPGSSGAASRGCVTLYAVFLFTLLALHCAVAGGFLFREDKTIEILQDLNAHGDNDAIRNYLDAHRTDFKWSSLAVVSVEALTFFAAICCGGLVRGVSDEEEEAEAESYRTLSMGVVSAPSDFTGGVSATPQTDARRAALSEKYGMPFQSSSEKKSTTTSFRTGASSRV